MKATVLILLLCLVPLAAPRPCAAAPGEPDDVVVRGRRVTVTVHSLGAHATRPTNVALLDRRGKTSATAAVSALEPPIDLMPKKVTLTLDAPVGASLGGGSVVIDPGGSMKEITRANNRVRL